MPPQHPKIEEKDTHEYVVGTHPQRITIQEKHIPYQRKEDDHPMQALYPLYKINNEIGDEEREQEPSGTISIKTACLPNMFPSQGFYRFVIPLKQERQEGEVYCHSYQAGRYIRNKYALGSINNIIPCSDIVHALVEKAGLKEEERHEIETPFHNMRPPLNFPQSTEIHNVKTYHTNNAKSAQEVKHMISFFHSAKVRKKMKSEK